MRLLLRERADALDERMDDPACDPEKLARTYRQFARINALVSDWSHVYRRQLRPALQSGARTVLDVGCGGGDVLRRLARLARRDGLSATFLGIDPDPRAIAFARAQEPLPGVSFEQADVRNLSTHFDLVLSNHVLHHLTGDEIRELCIVSERLARVGALHNDLCRADPALLLFPLVGGWFRGSFIYEDGLRSIRRAFTVEELTALAPSGWRVRPSVPFRLQLSWNL
jgi:2-polyprenyl-3-methyl-5-hydroxy-6-metoxy-1,4-benzoquinol methylase